MAVQLLLYEEEIIPVRVESVLVNMVMNKDQLLHNNLTFLVSEVLMMLNPPPVSGLAMVTYGSDRDRKSRSLSPRAPRPMLMVGPFIFQIDNPY